MAESFDLDKLIEDVKGLFNHQNSFNTAPATTMSGVPHLQNGEVNSNIFQSPIKGSWNSSGGFDPVSVRPNGRKGHMGVDMRVAAGTPIYPLAPGIVTNVGTDPVGGNVINIQHASGVRSYYAHLSSAKVSKGDKVDLNTIIGAVGDSGNAAGTWPHLHFQVWKDNQIQDPAKYFNVPQYTAVNEQEKQQGKWISPEAQQEAQAFNMKEHVSQRRIAFSREVHHLQAVATQFYRLVVQNNK